MVAPHDIPVLMLGELRFSRRTLPRISRSLAKLEEVPKSIDPQHPHQARSILPHMLHGAGIFTNICLNKYPKCR